jgi:hypothetical protein
MQLLSDSEQLVEDWLRVAAPLRSDTGHCNLTRKYVKLKLCHSAFSADISRLIRIGRDIIPVAFHGDMKPAPTRCNASENGESVECPIVAETFSLLGPPCGRCSGWRCV